jgi:type I restriction enzyme S subunit
MDNNIKSYNKYKSVDYDYIDKIPKRWELLPNFAIFEERVTKDNIDKELLSVTINKGVIRQKDSNNKDNSNIDKSNYKLVKRDDIVYNKMRMWQGAVGYSEYDGVISPAYIVLKSKFDIEPRFFHYLFRSSFYINYSKRFSYGLCDDQLNLRYKDFKRMYSIVPPLDIQKKIADKLIFLDKLLILKMKEIEKIYGRKVNQQSESIPNNFYDFIVYQLVTGSMNIESLSNDKILKVLNI